MYVKIIIKENIIEQRVGRKDYGKYSIENLTQ